MGHFTNEHSQLQCLTLGVKELDGTHLGENQAALALNTLNDFEIRNCLGYFIMDYVFSNNKLINTIANNFKRERISYDAVQRCLQCNGHVINLSAQTFLFWKISEDLDYLTESLNTVIALTQDQLERWRSMGPLGKLHNIVVQYIRLTPQRKQKFKKLSGGLLLHRDQKTRYNSFYEMMNQVLERLKDAIIQFSTQEHDLEEDVLKSTEWLNLTHIRDFLKPFYEIILATEGRKHTIERILLSIKYLLSHYKAALDTFADNRFVLSALNAGYDKLIKYFNKYERNPVYISTVVLQPNCKWAMFGKWESEDLATAKQELRTMWQLEYNTVGLTSTQVSSEPTPKSDFAM